MWTTTDSTEIVGHEAPVSRRLELVCRRQRGRANRRAAHQSVERRAQEAHRVGKRVAAHATDDQATRIAADAGVNSIEHGYSLPDDVIKIMKEKSIFLVPTDYPAQFYVIGAIEAGKFADIIAVDGDPLKDVKDVQHVSFVMKGGQVVRNDGPARE